MYKFWKASQNLAREYQLFAGSGSALITGGAVVGIVWYKGSSIQETINKEGVILDKQGVMLDKRGVMLDKRGVMLDKRGVMLDKRGVILDNQGKKLNNMETSLAVVERAAGNRAAVK
ncbi:hypothetical protein LTR10_017419 [Elasticomyces elasticus]|uniref:Uncharacterized protein n=1 Tax=Exophiala sideris TaxID=1016849 RepID=A0ABR0JAK5_9EURO|nr:hypothetical protein LTR10_017419 [Elasticomyces elasticus]KAK5030399.1 hypothetical protein LTS07_005183 [Exophiala sideris]KAK5060335.1 hypothetical protein LTR69_005652 [Exophiala sideris]